jgi:hypothetical protein
MGLLAGHHLAVVIVTGFLGSIACRTTSFSFSCAPLPVKGWLWNTNSHASPASTQYPVQGWRVVARPKGWLMISPSA